jgi:hypothetical protein
VLILTDSTSLQLRNKQALNNLNAEVEMTTEGQWRYFVYANSSSSNLDPTGLLELESGIVKVTGTTTPVTSYSGGNSNYVVYGS